MTAAQQAGQAVYGAFDAMVPHEQRQRLLKTLERSNSQFIRDLSGALNGCGPTYGPESIALVLARAVDKGQADEPLPSDPLFAVVSAGLEMIRSEGVTERDLRPHFRALKENLRPQDPNYGEIHAIEDDGS